MARFIAHLIENVRIDGCSIGILSGSTPALDFLSGHDAARAVASTVGVVVSDVLVLIVWKIRELTAAISSTCVVLIVGGCS